jgi:hypothetical protein
MVQQQEQPCWAVAHRKTLLAAYSAGVVFVWWYATVHIYSLPDFPLGETKTPYAAALAIFLGGVLALTWPVSIPFLAVLRVMIWALMTLYP